MLLTEFLARLADVEETADGWLGKCAGHADSKPSLRVAVGASGKVIVKCRAGCSTPDVLTAMGLTLADLASMEPGDAAPVRAASTDAPAGPAEVAALAVRLDGWARALDGDSDATDAGYYAWNRFGLAPQDAERLGLGYAADLGGGPRLVVPFRDRDGVARGFQARALAPDAAVRWLGPKSPEGGSWAKVGWFPGAAGWDEVLVCEGPGDALTAAALGYDAICIRGAGLASNPTVIGTVAEWVGDRLAVVAGDGDPAGRAFSVTLARALAERGTRAKILDLPDGLDLTDWRAADPARFATEAVRAVLSAAEVTGATAALRSRDEAAYPLTDLGNARFARDFIAARGSGVRFSPEAGFFLLDGGVWRPDRLDRTRAYVQEAADLVASVARSLRENAATPDDIKAATRWGRWATYSQSSNGMTATMRELQSLRDVAVDVNDLDRHPDLLACRNGVVNLRTGALGPHDPELLLTRRVEHDYDPAARAPRWERFLAEVFPGHPDLPGYMRRLVGYGITGHTTEQCFAVLWGKGANGKSVFTDTLTEVFRELTVTTPFSTFEEKPSGGIPNDLAALKGARLVMASEGEQGRRMAEAVLKRVTGRDLISARFMRREFFEFRPAFLLMLATNFQPEFRGQDEGLWRRVKLIPWERYFAPHERDHRLGEQLLAEAPGIFTWAVRGAVEWRADGLADPGTVVGATKQYRETSDALAGFMPERWVLDEAAPVASGSAIFADYLAWCEEENLPPKDRWSRKTFFSALAERGVEKRRSASGMAFAGIRRTRAADHEGDGPAEVVCVTGAPAPNYQSATPIPASGPSLDDVF